MKVVAIKEMSAGNDSVGEMWKETKIFESEEPIENILEWAMEDAEYVMKHRTRKQITITVPHN